MKKYLNIIPIIAIFYFFINTSLVYGIDSFNASTDKIISKHNKAIIIKDDGTLWTYENYTQKNFIKSFIIPDIKEIDFSAQHYIAVKNDGTVWTWGANNYGQLGVGNTTNSNTPVKVEGLDNVSKVYADTSHSFAIKKDGTVYAWGENGYWNNLGMTVETNIQTTPRKVEGLSNIVKLVTDSDSSYAISGYGKVFAWGYNGNGEIGLGDYVKMDKPKMLPISDVIVDVYSNSGVSFAKTDSNELWCWGNGSDGRLGTGRVEVGKPPVKLSSINDVKKVSIAEAILVLKNDGSVWSFGKNIGGVLGNGNLNDRYFPSRIETLTEIDDIDISSNSITNCIGFAKGSNGCIYTWGGSDYEPNTYPRPLKDLQGTKILKDGLFLNSDNSLYRYDYTGKVIKLLFGAEPRYSYYQKSGVYSNRIYFSVSKDADSKVFYTTDGTQPTTSSKQMYSLTINNSTQLKFIVVDKNQNISRTVNETYYIADSNNDGKTDIIDFAKLARNYNSKKTDTNWDNTCDINLDGIVDIYDLTMVSRVMDYMQKIDEMHITLTRDEAFNLPKSIPCNYGNNNIQEETVEWDNQVVDTSKTGSTLYTGKITTTGYNVKLFIDVIENADSNSVNTISNQFTHYKGWYYYINNLDGGKIYKVKEDGTGKQCLTSSACIDFIVADQYILFRRNAGGPSSEILRVGIDGTNEASLSQGLLNLYGVKDGWVYYTDSKFNMFSAVLMRMKVDGTEKTALTQDSCYNVSFYGNNIFYSNSSEGNVIFKINFDGTEAQKLTDNQVNDYYKRMVAANGGIYFASGRMDNPSMKRLDLKTGISYTINTSLSEVKGIYHYQNKLYFIANNEGRTYIYSCNILGGDLIKIHDGPSSSTNSIDNLDIVDNRIIFRECAESNTYKIYEMNLDGSDLKEFAM